MNESETRYMGNAITRLCGVQYPIFLAGMAAISGPRLVAAVADAGGMGTLGGLRLPPQMLRKWIQETRSLTDRPFGVNLVPSFGGPEVFDAQFRVVLQERPRMLSLFYAEDYSADMICRAKEAGMIVMVQVGTVALARMALERGADIIVAQGSESGGHLNRGTIGLLSLLPALCEIAHVPVLAAGGITTRDDVRAVMELGASGVLVGTAFVASEESNAHPLYKQKIVDATVDDTEYRTGYSFGWKYGTPHRVIPNRDRWNFLRFVGGGARVIDKPRMAQKLSLYAGQGVGKISGVMPAAERVAELAAGLAERVATAEAAGVDPMRLAACPSVSRQRATPAGRARS